LIVTSSSATQEEFMACICGNTLGLSPDGVRCLSCAHMAALFDNDDVLEELEPVRYDDDDEQAHALALDLDDIDSSLDMGMDEMYLLLDW
jgi:hypothetical protein